MSDSSDSERVSPAMNIAFAAPLVYLYIFFLVQLLSDHVLAGASSLELLLLVTQVITLAVVMSIRRLRTGSIALIADLFSLPIFAFPVLVGLCFYYNQPWLLYQGIAILVAWPSAMLCVVPVYCIYRLMSIVRNNRRLLHLIPSAVAVFALLVFLVSAISSALPPEGLANLSHFLLSFLLQTRSVGVTTEGEVAGVLLYMALLIYSITRVRGSTATARNSVLMLAIIGTLTTICLTLLASDVSIYPLSAYGVSGYAILTAIWWITRAH